MNLNFVMTRMRALSMEYRVTQLPQSRCQEERVVARFSRADHKKSNSCSHLRKLNVKLR
jgi:hypothetical protein